VNYINNNTNYCPQNQGWNQQQRPSYSGNYQGNYQGNNFNNFNTPLRDLVAGQSRLLDQMSNKIASNDKLLETINNRMDSFTSAIKNQHSFNKMIESQITQLASSIPQDNKGKIPRQLEELETTNLVYIFSAGWYYRDRPSRGWKDDSIPEKKGDPGRPAIPIAIGPKTFEEAICDFGASVNIMPKVIYEKIHGDQLLYTTMCLQLVDQSLCYPKGNLEDVYV
jgi:hypothetical protein